MKCIELKVVVNAPDYYEYSDPLDVLIDSNDRDRVDLERVELLDEYYW